MFIQIHIGYMLSWMHMYNQNLFIMVLFIMIFIMVFIYNGIYNSNDSFLQIKRI